MISSARSRPKFTAASGIAYYRWIKDDLQTAAATYRLGFIGGGKLVGAVIRGLLRGNFARPAEIILSEPNEQSRLTLRQETGVTVTAENREAALGAETIIIGVKPGVVLPVLREIAGALQNKLVISLAAGVRLEKMEATGDARFIRVMTNTPAAVGRAATAIVPGQRARLDDVARAQEIFGALGIAVSLKEEQIDAVTGLSGSGPAFVYTVIEALAAGGEKAGLPAGVAAQLATHTVLGAAQLAAETGLSPEELRRMVVTPGGTTAAGLEAMEKKHAAEGLSAAVVAATARGREMAEESL